MKGGREKRRNCEKKFRKKIEKAKINAEKVQYIHIYKRDKNKGIKSGGGI
jgi:hypothetical protein